MQQTDEPSVWLLSCSAASSVMALESAEPPAVPADVMTSLQPLLCAGHSCAAELKL